MWSRCHCQHCTITSATFQKQNVSNVIALKTMLKTLTVFVKNRGILIWSALDIYFYCSGTETVIDFFGVLLLYQNLKF